MTMVKYLVRSCATLAVALNAGTAMAQGISDGVVKIGVLGDMSGVYSTGFSGPGAVAAVKMAVQDYGGKVLGKPVEVISADHTNKPDIASTIAREWIDRDKVDMIIDLTNSAVALAVQKLASDKHTITFAVGAATTALSGKACTKYGLHYGIDTRALSVGTAAAMVQNGGRSWYFITADYAFGHDLQASASAVIKALGGSVLGSSLTPIGTADFSSYLLQAQSSGAQVIALANAGQDTVNAIKQAHEFGIDGTKHQLAGMLVLESDVKSLGMDTAKGLNFTVGWHWNRDAKSRAWKERYMKFSNGAAPTFLHAADYSATMAYLKAVEAAGTDDANAVRTELGKDKIDDFFADGGQIRADGLLVHDMYLLKVKASSESTDPWDVANVVRVIPGNDAFGSLEEGGCPLVK